MADVEDILKNQYKEGKKIISMSKTSHELLGELQEQCSHVQETDLIRLFKSVAAGTKMVDSAIIAAAHNMEYNATHPVPKKTPWFTCFFTDAAHDIITPVQLMRKKKLYQAYLQMLSELEAKYDTKDIPAITIFRRRTTTFLKEHIEEKK